MSQLKYFDYPGFGERTTRDINASQAVRVGDVIEVAGQGGWDPNTEKFPESISDEITQAFSNVALALKHAGCPEGWDKVFKVNVYMAVSLSDEAAMDSLVENLKKWCPKHPPVLTVVEVKGLFNNMRIEVESRAYVGK